MKRLHQKRTKSLIKRQDAKLFGILLEDAMKKLATPKYLAQIDQEIRETGDIKAYMIKASEIAKKEASHG